MHTTFPELRTSRLLLRDWRPEDEAPFATLNADAEVTEFLLGPMSREQSDAQIRSFREHFAREGFGRWAVEVPGLADFIGTVGITVIPYQAHFTPCVEIAWRLARPYWGQGFASEAAHAALRFGFENVGLAEIVALTVPANKRSQAVMERIGMVRNPADDFDHPLVPDGHPLQRHVLYRMSQAEWLAARS
ncbi:GNAT family N-acetyltransferase [Variovorax sp. J22R133]|nr:GNAT family N-acetyltransferase [Variovorax sp. J22R133]MDM0112212.1 GNAT family N-acetyltransferase [Variovorax sp. J22R133]